MVEVSKGGPLLSVIVPVFNDAEGLRQCLAAMERQTLSKDRFEVIVVDNGSRCSLEPVLTAFPFARSVVEPTPGSYAARNAGVAFAKGGILVFTDADCQPSPDWLEQIDRMFASNPGLSAIGGRIESTISEGRATAELYELVLPPIPQQQLIQRMGFAATANLAVRADAFNAVGPFNARLLSSGDREWGNRLVAAGHELRYAPEARVLHPARTNIRALCRRRLRIEGGKIGLTAIQPGRGEVWQSSRPYPPRRKIAMGLLLTPGRFMLSRAEGLKVLVLATWLVVVRKLERLRLRLGGRPLR